eukprot:TRINITY_DN5672_c0_g1_i1.p1 TRINITY_DN5672_c0_g1~~TRINITY_DN5672_c0_g1_i1.p1  ORF type:complete len:541 (+),score=114.17 TRINITY_DN5672_c0_g1_i1:19-1641(+)
MNPDQSQSNSNSSKQGRPQRSPPSIPSPKTRPTRKAPEPPALILHRSADFTIQDVARTDVLPECFTLQDFNFLPIYESKIRDLPHYIYIGESPLFGIVILVLIPPSKDDIKKTPKAKYGNSDRNDSKRRSINLMDVLKKKNRTSLTPALLAPASPSPTPPSPGLSQSAQNKNDTLNNSNTPNPPLATIPQSPSAGSLPSFKANMIEDIDDVEDNDLFIDVFIRGVPGDIYFSIPTKNYKVASSISTSASNSTANSTSGTGGASGSNAVNASSGSSTSKPKLLLREFLSRVTAYQNTTFEYIKGTQVESDMLTFEKNLKQNNFKFGLLLRTDPDGDENALYSTNKITPDFEEFMKFLGDLINLKGWTKYNAGLDTKTNLDGSQSVYTTFQEFEIMWHVGPLLTYSDVNPQQIQRKKYVGNDVCVVVFDECNKPFDPNLFTSRFNHIVMVVRKRKDLSNSNQTFYELSVSSKDGVGDHHPFLPKTRIMEKSPQLREFIYTKLINAERAAFLAQAFTRAISKTREGLLRNLFWDVYVKDKKQS